MTAAAQPLSRRQGALLLLLIAALSAVVVVWLAFLVWMLVTL